MSLRHALLVLVVASSTTMTWGSEATAQGNMPGGPLFDGPAGGGSSFPNFPASPDLPPWQPRDLGSTSLGVTDVPPLVRPQVPLRAADVPGIGPGSLPTCDPARCLESSWYTRVDYFHWNERLDGADFVNEDGPLVTLGYARRVGRERFRVELFGGSVHYDGGGVFDDGSSEPLSSTTKYLGVRGEYDLLFDPDWMPRWSFLLGIGTRFWIRDLKDDVTDLGSPVEGYQETWWTIYPYLGLESRRQPGDGFELFASGRIGFTPVTYERASLFEVTLYPKTGLTGQLEVGLRSRRVYLSGYFEGMSWGESPVVRDTLQPRSRMFLVGLRSGVSF